MERNWNVYVYDKNDEIVFSMFVVGTAENAVNVAEKWANENVGRIHSIKVSII